MDAFRSALEGGADGIECDFRLSEDGTLFVMHDREIAGYPVEKMNKEERQRFSLPDLEEVLLLEEEYPDKYFLVEAKTLEAGREFLRKNQPRERLILISFLDQVIQEAGGAWHTVLLEAASPDVLRDRTPKDARPGPSAMLLHGMSREEITRSYVWVVNDPLAAEQIDAWAIGTDCCRDFN